MIDLDDAGAYAAVDRANMRALIAGLPRQCRDAWAAAREWELPPSLHRPRRVVVAGMGGSAIGADVVATLTAHASAVPVTVCRGYELPRPDAETLAVACSFSGETEETLAAFRSTLAEDGMRLAITTGGTLARLAAERGVPLFTYEWDGPPRSALGYGLFPLLAILERLDVLTLAGGEPERAFAALERAAERWALAVPERDNEAKRLARRLHERVPLIVGAGYLEVAARRWAAQLNENSKQWAFAAALPEADHNLVLGFPAPSAARELLHAVFLDAAPVHPRTRLRVGLTAGLLDDAGVAYDRISVDGDSMLESLLLAISLGDWVSLYLAMLNDADPTEMAALEELKVALAERRE